MPYRNFSSGVASLLAAKTLFFFVDLLLLRDSTEDSPHPAALNQRSERALPPTVYHSIRRKWYNLCMLGRGSDHGFPAGGPRLQHQQSLKSRTPGYVSATDYARLVVKACCAYPERLRAVCDGYPSHRSRFSAFFRTEELRTTQG